MKINKNGPPYDVPDNCPSPEVFAKLFNNALMWRGLSIREAARMSGVNEKTLQRYSNGSHRPSEKILDILQKELGIEREELLGRSWVAAAARQAEEEAIRKRIIDVFGKMEGWERTDFLRIVEDIDANFLPLWAGGYVLNRTEKNDNFLFWLFSLSTDEQDRIVDEVLAKHGQT